MAKSSKKLPTKPFTGAEGNTFSASNQPTPEQKKAGWEEWRKQRNLTKGVIDALMGEDGKGGPLKTYIAALVKNAKDGNPKAIDAVNKCLEDDVIKIDHSISNIAVLSIDPLSNVIDADNNSTPQDSGTPQKD